MPDQDLTEEIGVYRRRRASDRARERATRAAWLGDRAGLLIATADVAQHVQRRGERRRASDPSD